MGIVLLLSLGMILIPADPLLALEDRAVAELGHRAETTVWRSFSLLWQERLKADMADTTRDSLRTGVIGLEYTPLTTTIGYEGAKGLSTRPGWASWIVAQLAAKGIREGDKVAFSMTGSFPALNLAVLAALQELKVEAHGISSVGSSSYGANEPGFTWPEIESLLRSRGVLKVGSGAVTFGGTGDRGLEWGDSAQALAAEVIRRSSLPLMKPRNLKDAISRRLLFYGDLGEYKCYINVGGSQASLGAGAKLRFTRGGWYEEPLGLRGDPDGVADKFLAAGVPFLNLLYLEDLNRRESVLKQ